MGPNSRYFSGVLLSKNGTSTMDWESPKSGCLNFFPLFCMNFCRVFGLGTWHNCPTRRYTECMFGFSKGSLAKNSDRSVVQLPHIDDTTQSPILPTQSKMIIFGREKRHQIWTIDAVEFYLPPPPSTTWALLFQTPWKIISRNKRCQHRIYIRYDRK